MAIIVCFESSCAAITIGVVLREDSESSAEGGKNLKLLNDMRSNEDRFFRDLFN